MFEDYDADRIMNDMIENIDENLDTREGSVIYDALMPMAIELSNYYGALDMVLREVYADTASYDSLVHLAASRGIYPKEASKAIVRMQATPPDAPISVNDVFAIDDNEYVVTSVIDNINGVYQMQCTTPGKDGNEHIGETLPLDSANDLNDLESAVITEVLVPGEDEEDVETLRERYFESFIEEPFGGNREAYVQMMNSIDGVGPFRVIRNWEHYDPVSLKPNDSVKKWFASQNADTLPESYAWIKSVYDAAENGYLTAGGTITIIFMNSEYEKPSDSLIKEVQDTIDPVSGEGYGLAPIGHVVMVHGAQEKKINYKLSIQYIKGYNWDSAMQSIYNAIDAYHLELKQSWSAQEESHTILRPSVITSRLLQLKEINEVTLCLINGKDENLQLDDASIPIRGDVSVI